MLAFKISLCVLTIAIAMLFAHREMKLRRELTDEMPEERILDCGEYTVFSGLRQELKRERFLSDLPSKRRSKLRVAGGLKCLFAVILVIEIMLLQRC